MKYGERLAAGFHAGRSLDPATVATWMEAARRHAGPGPVARILDLGSGTGRFAAALARTFDAEVAAVEPSESMRRVAVDGSGADGPTRVEHLAGSAGEIPLGDGSVDLAWLSMILHHVEDEGAMCRELARVVRPGGRVIIRSAFKGRLGSVQWFRFFPSAHDLENARMPDLDELVACFGRHGFRRVAFESIEQVLDPSLESCLSRVRGRAYSTVELLDEAEFEEGLRAMETAARAEDPPRPVTEMIDLLVLERVGDRDADAAGDASSRLIEFLRDRDAECPVCGYNLRDLVRTECPECQQKLELTVGVRELNTLWLVATVAPGIFSGLAAAFLMVPIIISTLRSPGNVPVGVVALDAFGWMSGLAALLVVRYRTRFMRQAISRQKEWAAVAWFVHALVFVILLSRIL